jgi:Phage portal protein, SPP1 Gp6-like
MATALQFPDQIQQNYIKWATDAIAKNLADYEKFQDYYDGDHSLVFATAKWTEAFGSEFEEFADNWCQVVVDSMVQRLEIIGWKSEDDDDAAKLAEDLYDRNELGIQEDDVHTQALVKGDSYVMCWPNPDNPDEAQIYYNDATEVAVYYDARTNRKITRAAKKYVNEKNETHLYLYYPDHTEHYFIPSVMTESEVAAFFTGVGPIQLPNGYVEVENVPNTYGEVPVYHFKNRALGSTHGMSEIKIVIPVQNAVNKMLMDLMVGSEFGSFRQKYVAGGGVPKDGWRVGGDRLWATSDPNARFGEFGQIDLEPISRAVEVLIGHIAKITQTPLFYLRSSGDVPSGEALKSSESGLVKKCLGAQQRFGSAWSKAMGFAIMLETGKKPKSPVFPVWKSPETRHDLEQGQVAQLKSILGIPLEKLWSEHFGYSEEEIADFKKQNKAVAASVLADVIAQVGQLPPGTEAITTNPQQLADLLTQGAQSQTGGLDIAQILAMLPKSATAQTTAGEATTKPQPHTRPPASPTRRGTGFKD